MKFITVILILLSISSFAQSSYSSADQNTSANDEGTQGDTGYVNKDHEKEMDSTVPMKQEQEEREKDSSGKNATRKRVKTPLDD